MSDYPPATDLIQAVTALDEDKALALVQARLQAGDDPVQIIVECQAGLRQVGAWYEERRYFLSGLIMAGEIFREIFEMLTPVLTQRPVQPAVGRVLLGTVQGDIHDIGKSLASLLLASHGFAVIDLGVDVAPEQFVIHAVETQPDIVGLSCLLSSAYDSMRQTTLLLKAEARQRSWTLPIIISGGTMDEHVLRYVGADYWAPDAIAGVRLCLRLMAER